MCREERADVAVESLGRDGRRCFWESRTPSIEPAWSVADQMDSKQEYQVGPGMGLTLTATNTHCNYFQQGRALPHQMSEICRFPFLRMGMSLQEIIISSRNISTDSFLPPSSLLQTVLNS